jgi:hypothetical protein
LFYDKDVFGYLEVSHVWSEIVEYLKVGRCPLLIPEVNFDLMPEIAFNEIKDLSLDVFKKFLSN